MLRVNHVKPGIGILEYLCYSGHPSSPLAPRFWPRSSCCSGHSPRLSGAPRNPPCTAPRLMSCLPAFSARPALCLRPLLVHQGVDFRLPCQGTPYLPASHCSACLDTASGFPIPHPGKFGGPQKLRSPASSVIWPPLDSGDSSSLESCFTSNGCDSV